MGLNHKLPHLSYSQVTQYLTCPMKHCFGYAQKRPKKLPNKVGEGSIIHNALSFATMREERDIDVILAEVIETMDYENFDDADSLLNSTGRLVELTLREALPVIESKYNIEAVELPVASKIKSLNGEYVFYSYIDALTDKGFLEYKTSNRNSKTISAYHLLQISFYKYLVEELGCEATPACVHINSATGKVTEKDIEGKLLPKQVVLAQFASVADRIAKQEYYPNKISWACASCEFAEACEEHCGHSNTGLEIMETGGDDD